MAKPKTKFNNVSKRIQAYRFNEDIDKEVKLLYDGLDGLLDRFNEFNKGNSKTLVLVENMIKTAFKLGYAVSRKERFKTITEEDFNKEMSL